MKRSRAVGAELHRKAMASAKRRARQERRRARRAKRGAAVLDVAVEAHAGVVMT